MPEGEIWPEVTEEMKKWKMPEDEKKQETNKEQITEQILEGSPGREELYENIAKELGLELRFRESDKYTGSIQITFRGTREDVDKFTKRVNEEFDKEHNKKNS